MTLEKLQEMSLLDILRKINLMQHKLNKTTEFMRRRRLKRAQVEQLREIEIVRGNVIPLYYRDEVTGLHYRATGPANYILNNEPPPDRAA